MNDSAGVEEALDGLATATSRRAELERELESARGAARAAGSGHHRQTRQTSDARREAEEVAAEAKEAAAVASQLSTYPAVARREAEILAQVVSRVGGEASTRAASLEHRFAGKKVSRASVERKLAAGGSAGEIRELGGG